MKKKILSNHAVATFAMVFLFILASAMAAEKTPPGEQAFLNHCAVCHPQGGNIVNAAKTLKRKDLIANGIRKPADIIKTMRNPGPGMTKFDEKEIPDRTAEEIARYIFKAFK